METLLPLLYSFATETDHAKRKELEATISQLGSPSPPLDPANFVTLLLQTLATPLKMDMTSKRLECTLEELATKRIAAIFVRNTLNTINKTTQLTDESAIFYARSILELTTKCALHQSIIDQLVLSLIPLIIPSNEAPMATIQARLLAVVPSLKELLKSFDATLVPVSGLLSCAGQILTIMIEYKVPSDFIRELLSHLEVIVGKEWMNLMNGTKSVVEGKDEIKEVRKSIGGIIDWMNITMKLFNKAKFKDLVALKYYIYSQSIPNIIAQSVQFIIPIGQQTTDTLLSCTGNLDTDNAVNEMKIAALEVVNGVLSYLYLTSLAAKVNTTFWYALCNMIGQPILNTLLKICVAEYDKFDGRCTDKVTKKFITSLLVTLCSMLEDNGFYPFFSTNKSTLLIDVIFLLMRSTQQEKQMLVTEPQEFINLGLDTCDKQSSHIPKTEAAKLLESICDHIDGAVTYVMRFCCEAARCAIATQPAEELKQSPLLGQFQNNFLTKSTPEEIVETCLIVMADLSYAITTRNDVFLLLENLMRERFKELFTSPSVLIRCRLALLLEYYIDKIYEGTPKLFEQTLEFLVKGVALEKEEKAFAIQCADSIYTTIGDADMIVRIDNCINKIFPYLSALVTTVEIGDYFNALMPLVTHYGETIGVSIIHLLNALVQRIEKEMVTKGEKNNIIISKCWNVIHSICDNKEFCPKFADSIENAMLPVFNYLANPKDIEFDEDIVDVVKILIDRYAGVSLNMEKIFPVLPKYFEKAECVFGNLLGVLNCYLFYGKTQFAQKKEWIDILIGMIEKSLFVTVAPEEENNAEGALLIQMMMQNIGGGLLNSCIPTLFQLILKRLNMKIEEAFLQVQLYNAFLCMVCNNGPLTLDCDKMQLGLLIDGIVNAREKFSTSYDRKVLAIGLANVLMYCTAPDFASMYFPKILMTVVYALKQQRIEDMKSHMKEDGQIISLEDSDEGESSDDEIELDAKAGEGKR
eukprot:TRINITY_DN355_c0_g4_i1.p1 TRINITY_DN355_c0_g4~~TRINITY_DN355_c0_g4_i1.p1  ORF type:complete len:979 (+),score=242.38 TRINITY_DN355_c0_g4_i1:128-3064(+)